MTLIWDGMTMGYIRHFIALEESLCLPSTLYRSCFNPTLVELGDTVC